MEKGGVTEEYSSICTLHLVNVWFIANIQVTRQKRSKLTTLRHLWIFISLFINIKYCESFHKHQASIFMINSQNPGSKLICESLICEFESICESSRSYGASRTRSSLSRFVNRSRKFESSGKLSQSWFINGNLFFFFLQSLYQVLNASANAKSELIQSCQKSNALSQLIKILKNPKRIKS